MANGRLSVQELFGHFKGCRAGIIRALTTEEEPMCLFGLPDGTWELRLPEDMVPPDLPEPQLGVNYGKSETSLGQWLQTVAAHSDSWLIALAFSIASNFHFGKKQRKMLFNKINELPTVLDTVKQFHGEEATIRSNSQTRSGEETHAQQSRVIAQPQEAQEDEEDDIPCESCGQVCEGDEFWIFCDTCKKWFHGDCVGMTPEIAGLIKRYRCPNCSCKRARV